jgi:hypoxanthine phosphoribosyltransferase
MSNVVSLHDKTFELYIHQKDIVLTVAELAERIATDYKGERPLFLSVLNGSFMFTADLLRHYTGECEVSFIKLASYQGTESTGKINELIGINESIKGRHIILLEDIVDTGNTIVALYDTLQAHAPASIKIATLLFKPEAYDKTIPVDYVGVTIPNKFVVGFGLDYDGLGRNLPNIYQLIQ